jgi:hypothetical protein
MDAPGQGQYPGSPAATATRLWTALAEENRNPVRRAGRGVSVNLISRSYSAKSVRWLSSPGAPGRFAPVLPRDTAGQPVGELRRDVYLFGDGGGLRNRISKLPHAFQVPLNGFLHQFPRFVQRDGSGNAPWKIRSVRAVTGRRRCIQYGVFHFFSPACLSAGTSVLGSRSADGQPEMIEISVQPKIEQFVPDESSRPPS